MEASDVEISDDVYILTAEEAAKHIEPPRLERLLVAPTSIQLKPGAKQTFRAEGLDQFGRSFPVSKVNWTATGGTIGSDGVLAAGPDEGSFIVTLASEDRSATATVVVAKEAKQQPIPIPTEAPKKLTWAGMVPPQKWSQLYMKVLTKLVVGMIVIAIRRARADLIVNECQWRFGGMAAQLAARVRLGFYRVSELCSATSGSSILRLSSSAIASNSGSPTREAKCGSSRIDTFD